jgi:hypothetical protein
MKKNQFLFFFNWLFNEAQIKDVIGNLGKLYDYIAINNNIFSDIDSFKIMGLVFKMNVKKVVWLFII